MASPDLIKNAAHWLVGYFSLIDVSEAWIARYQWKLMSDKYILYHGCPMGQVKKWLSYLLKVIFYDKNVLLCQFYRRKLRK